MTMVDVGVWEPEDVPLTADTLRRLSEAAGSLGEDRVGLSPQEVTGWAGLMRYPAEAWVPLLSTEPDDRLVRLVKWFTVAEMRLPGWEAGARSPVIAIVRELRRRGAYPTELTAWIKAHTTNRFLPWGSLTDRL
jgi:hypothetical protein